MSDEVFSFAMGEFAASFPSDRLYVKNHMWASRISESPNEGTRFRFGLTAYAIRLLQDVYFLDWLLEPQASIVARQHIGSIESKKAESDLYAPLGGTLAAINEAALDDPSLINAESYGDGWLIEINTNTAAELLSPEQYAAHLIEAWDVAQKTIKGQANQ